MADMDRMFGTFEPPVTTEDGVLLTGKAPVACLRDYQREVIAYTKGRGHLSLWFKDYEPCHNAEEVIEAAGYDPEADLENTADSVFCSHGAGYLVPWYQVKEYMHVESPLEKLGRREMGRMILTGACREIWAGLLVMQVLVQVRMALPLVLEVPVLAPPGVMTKNWKRFSTAVSAQENGAADRIHRVVPLPRGPEIILQTYP